MLGFLDEIAKAIDIGAAADYKCIMLSCNAVYIDGHKGIVSFSPHAIKIKTKKEVLTIEGEQLKIKQMTKNEIAVIGQISRVCR